MSDTIDRILFTQNIYTNLQPSQEPVNPYISLKDYVLNYWVYEPLTFFGVLVVLTTTFSLLFYTYREHVSTRVRTSFLCFVPVAFLVYFYFSTKILEKGVLNRTASYIGHFSNNQLFEYVYNTKATHLMNGVCRVSVVLLVQVHLLCSKSFRYNNWLHCTCGILSIMFCILSFCILFEISTALHYMSTLLIISISFTLAFIFYR